jgi:hypothetical protein
MFRPGSWSSTAQPSRLRAPTTRLYLPAQQPIPRRASTKPRHAPEPPKIRAPLDIQNPCPQSPKSATFLAAHPPRQKSVPRLVRIVIKKLQETKPSRSILSGSASNKSSLNESTCLPFFAKGTNGGAKKRKALVSSSTENSNRSHHDIAHVISLSFVQRRDE